jgi:hypothetical protein
LEEQRYLFYGYRKSVWRMDGKKSNYFKF